MNKIFTSYLQVNNNDCNNLYINELIPQWVKVNRSICDQIHIITNIPDSFTHLDVNTHYINIDSAFKNINPQENIFHHQVQCWKSFLDTLSVDECCVYLDPDAFLLDSVIFNIASIVDDHQLSKKRFPYGCADAGIAILRNTVQTKEMLNSVFSLFNNAQSPRCIIEHYYDNTFRGNNKYYISWSNYSVCLRDIICGNNISNINAIHGEYTGNVKLTADQRILVKLISNKERQRKY
jgi:hypothetical protein